MYNSEGDEESIIELLAGNYYVVIDEAQTVIGFFCFGDGAQVPSGNEVGAYSDTSFVDIGLGMRPDLCGHGGGYDFFVKGLMFAKSLFNTSKFRLTVASFNKRAIRLYERLGFIEVKRFERKTEVGMTEFVVMVGIK